MRLSPTTIAVKRITSKVPRSNFSEDELTQVAKHILEVEGIINPPVVIETGVRSYEVADGDFEYYAAVRARELDLRRGEMIGVFIISPENETSLREQVKLLRKQQPVASAPSEPYKADGGIRFTNIESRLTNIESIFNSKINELEKKNQVLEEDVRTLKEQKLKQVQTPLDVFNVMAKENLGITMMSAGIRGKRAAELLKNIETEQKKRKFESLIDLKDRVDKLGETSIIKIIDAWFQSCRLG